MLEKDDDWTGALNLITHAKELAEYDLLTTQYYQLNRELCTVVEMECMSDYDYVLEIYDSAIGTGLRAINTDFPKATTKEEFEFLKTSCSPIFLQLSQDIISKLEDSVKKLEAVKRVIEMCFVNNFIKFA
uniref:DHC_N1 domain-containing protein n=1 Tax=Caenorhabditis tropicalis TaxID=1561998 RepID=A0A1I7U170_9PELO